MTTRVEVSSSPVNMPRSSLYDSYEAWKGWDKPFTVTAEERDYFSGEMRGIRIKGTDLLEIGFGSGSFLAWAREQGARVAGTEINERLLAYARQNDVELLARDIENIASAHAGRFDTIIAFDVFEHFSLADVHMRLRAAEMLLKPGGHLVMRFPNAQSPFGLAPQNGDPTHLSALSRSIFEQLMQGTSFAVVRYRGSFRTPGRGITQRFVRSVRYAARNALAAALNFMFARVDFSWDPVVVLVLRKSDN